MSTILSVIAPVYNVEEYLKRFIESIHSQSFTDFELILVDDGSTDRCGEIIDEYSEIESRIIPIHLINSGCSNARNIGISAASGEFVLFADPDDWIEQGMFQTMFEMLRNTKSDLCCCG